MPMLSNSMKQEEVLSPKKAKNNTHSSSSSKKFGFQGLQNKLSRKEDEDGSGCFERVFAYFDEDGDGRVSAAELQKAVRAVGGQLTEEEAEMAVRLSDSDGDGMLGLEDFTKLMEGKGVEEERKEDELREAFGMYVMKGTSFITPKSLKKMLARLGESTSIDNCRAMIRRFDLNGDGVLCFNEFKVMMS